TLGEIPRLPFPTPGETPPGPSKRPEPMSITSCSSSDGGRILSGTRSGGTKSTRAPLAAATVGRLPDVDGAGGGRGGGGGGGSDSKKVISSPCGNAVTNHMGTITSSTITTA